MQVSIIALLLVSGMCRAADIVTCAGQSHGNNTVFTNPGYPEKDHSTFAGGSCVLTVQLTSTTDICQLRLDLDEFSLAQPTADGFCKDDSMTVTGGSSVVPVICGENAGQHVYVEVDSLSMSGIRVNIDVSGRPGVGRKWKMTVAHIPCDSKYRAPAGCLQYHTTTSATVTSFNYQRSLVTPTRTRQLAKQEYGVCVQPRIGYCGVTWSRPTVEGPYYFTVTHDAATITMGVGGYPYIGNECTTDYVIIPEGRITDGDATVNVTSADRFCGTRFPDSVQSAMQPFSLYVVTDAVEFLRPNDTANDIVNQGFNLQYRLNVC